MAKRLDAKDFMALIVTTVRASKEGVHRAALEKMGVENGWATKATDQVLRVLCDVDKALAVRRAIYYDIDRLKAIEDRLGQTYLDIAQIREPGVHVIVPMKPVEVVVPDVMIACDVCGKKIPSAPNMTAKVLEIHKNRAHAPKPLAPPSSIPPEERHFFDVNGRLRPDWDSRLSGFRRRTCKTCGKRQDRIRIYPTKRSKHTKRAKGIVAFGSERWYWSWETIREPGEVRDCRHGNHRWEYDPPFHFTPGKGPNGPGSPTGNRERTPKGASATDPDAVGDATKPILVPASARSG